MVATSTAVRGYHAASSSDRRRRLRRASPRLSLSSWHSVMRQHYRIQQRSYFEWIIALATFCFIITLWSLKVVILDALHEKSLLYEMYHHPTNSDPLRLEEKRLLRYQSPGDPRFLTLRQRLEHDLPSKEEMLETIDSQRVVLPESILAVAPDRATGTRDYTDYNIYDCPPHPPEGYPVGWNAIHVLRHWNPDQTSLPDDFIYQSLCVFDWKPRNANGRTIDRAKQRQQHAAILEYRQSEVPFIVRNHPEVAATSYRWSMVPDYLPQLIGESPQRTEYSKNNHLMFWRLGRRGGNMNFVPPTKNIQISFRQWRAQAEAFDAQDQHQKQQHLPHFYFRLNAALPNVNSYLYDELPMFQPYTTTEMQLADNSTQSVSLFMIDSTQQRGINCRFGMKGSIAEMHFDPTRNWIVVLRGIRRYILADPGQCPFLELYPNSHPSGRHSSVDWSTVANRSDSQSSRLNQARVNEVVLQAGDALYLPTSWFHFIVSLNTNYQCNARSGVTLEHRRTIQDCGFDVPPFS